MLYDNCPSNSCCLMSYVMYYEPNIIFWNVRIIRSYHDNIVWSYNIEFIYDCTLEIFLKLYELLYYF